MPSITHRRRLPIPAVDARVLWDDAAETLGFGRLLDYVIAPAEHPFPPRELVRYRATGGPRGLSIETKGVQIRHGLGARSAVDEIYRLAHVRSFEDLAADGWLRLHGGLLDLDGRRLLLSGPSDAGKTTVLVQLLLDGADVSGDEWVLWRRGVAVAFPRRFHLAEGTPELIPALADLWDDLHTFPLVGGGVSRALDPTDLGRPWRVTSRAVDHILLLDRRDEGPSRLEPLPRTEAVRRLLGQAFADSRTSAPGGRGPLVGSLCELVNQSACWALRANHPADVAGLLEDAISAGPASR